MLEVPASEVVNSSNLCLNSSDPMPSCVVVGNESCLRSLSMNKIELIKLEMKSEKALKVSQSLEGALERCDKLYLEASLIQASIDGEEIKSQIENVIGGIEQLHKTCLNLLINVKVGSPKSKFVKGVSTPPKNSKDDVFGLYGNTIALIPVRAHVPSKVVALNLLKESKVKDPDVAENSIVSGLGDKVRQLDWIIVLCHHQYHQFMQILLPLVGMG